MYGLVNNGVRSFILKHHDEDTWSRICNRAGVPDDEFENLSAYEDGITYALVSAVSHELAVPAERVLEIFGQYWVGFSKVTAIGKLVDHGASELMEQIRGLDEMHERIQMSMPHLDPPSFDFQEDPDGNHRLHYISSRQGLAPMVIGLLKGMAEDCGVGIEIDHVENRESGASNDVFVLRILSKTASAA